MNKWKCSRNFRFTLKNPSFKTLFFMNTACKISVKVWIKFNSKCLKGIMHIRIETNDCSVSSLGRMLQLYRKKKAKFIILGRTLTNNGCTVFLKNREICWDATHHCHAIILLLSVSAEVSLSCSLWLRNKDFIRFYWNVFQLCLFHIPKIAVDECNKWLSTFNAQCIEWLEL